MQARSNLTMVITVLAAATLAALQVDAAEKTAKGRTGSPAADAAPPESGQEPVNYMIVVTGGELLSGAYADGHTCFLTRTLHPLGLNCVGSMTVGDKKAELKDALRFATGKASLVIVTGGLGPTDNDITRDALADFTGIALKEQPGVLQEMARRFRVSPDRLRPNLRRQAQAPIRGACLKNPNGTAVGLVFEPGNAVIVALPGPPRELQPMVRDRLVPYLSRRFGTRLPGCSLTLRFVGLGQSRIDQTLKDHVPLPPGVTLSSQFEGGRVDFTFSLPNDTPQDRAQLQHLKQEILKHLGDHVYADDDTSLEQCVVKLLETRGATLALAEAGSGGALAAGLTAADGSDRVLAGAYVASTEEKLRRLLRVPDDKWAGCTSDPKKVNLLASAAAERTGNSWTVVVGEPRLGAGGDRCVEVALKPPGSSTQCRHVPLRGRHESARTRLVTQLLDLLRQELLKGQP